MAGGEAPFSLSKWGVELVRQGMSYAAAARSVGLTPEAVRIASKRAGIVSPTTADGRAAASRARWRDPQYRSKTVSAKRLQSASYWAMIGVPDPVGILRQHEAGATYRQIADKYLMTREQVAGYVFRARKGIYSSTGSPRRWRWGWLHAMLLCVPT